MSSDCHRFLYFKCEIAEFEIIKNEKFQLRTTIKVMPQINGGFQFNTPIHISEV